MIEFVAEHRGIYVFAYSRQDPLIHIGELYFYLEDFDKRRLTRPNQKFIQVYND